MTPRRVALLLLLIALHATSAQAQEPRPYQGMRLAEALQQLQARGLRIVFSSALVPADLRVLAEPRAATPRRQLDELVAPHGLAVREGPGRTLQIVRAPAPRRQTQDNRDPSEGPGADSRDAGPLVRYRDFVTVTDALPVRIDAGVASEVSFERDDFARLHGAIAEDPLRIVQSFPGVAAVDDFGNDFTVRGSPFRHVDLVVDGVSTPWLRHTAFGRGAAGSLTMLSGLVIERATLRTGAYPRRHGDRLGSQLELSLRQGSRQEFVFHGTAGSTHAVIAAEGPLGRGGPATARGSWLVSARRSYLEWPPERAASSRSPFGFSDAVTTLGFDLTPNQQLAVMAIAGTSSVDEDEETLAPSDLADGATQASAISVSWQSTLGSALVIRQQGSIVAQRFWNRELNGRERDGGTNQAVAYRAEVSRAVGRGVLEVKALVELATARERSATPGQIAFEASSWQRSGFAHFTWPATPSLTLSPGVRVTWSTLASRPVVSRWLLGEWSFRRDWSVIGSAGASRQLPELRHLHGDRGSAELRPERAAHGEVAIEQRLSDRLRWQLSVFSRREADVLRSPDLHPRLVGDTFVWPAFDERYRSALRGASHGVEVLVSRRNPDGLSGWATYAYGRTRHRDPLRAESFWADFDQRHTFNVFAQYRVTTATSAGATFRAGSGFPVRGYFAGSPERLSVGTARNEARLPPYVRLDLRADRRFHAFGRSFVMFVEAVNALNRVNVGLADGSIDPATGAATGFTEPLLRRRMSAGIVFEF
jgi:hypothetical protein